MLYVDLKLKNNEPKERRGVKPQREKEIKN